MSFSRTQVFYYQDCTTNKVQKLAVCLTDDIVKMFWIFFGLIFVLIVIPCLLRADPDPVKGVYRLKGKWSYFKYWSFYVLFKLREFQNKRKSTVSGENAGYGIRSRSNVEEMERPQKLPEDHPQVSVFFSIFIFLESCFFQIVNFIIVIAESAILQMHGSFYLSF